MTEFPSTAELVAGIRAGDRVLLARALTLVESELAPHHQQAQELLQSLLPQTGGAWRIGITGVPGVGKSTFLDQLGMHLAQQEKKVAVLAVDPSSRVSGGSILGDKSRMHRLAQEATAFIRPSPSGQTLGGVARRTREAMLLCEAAGFDVIFVETVGVGQSETVVADMVDFFMVLMLPGAGDELQGIKRGILELADMLVVNKADGDFLPRAKRAQRDYANALQYLQPSYRAWKPQVVCVSGLHGTGIPELWKLVVEHRVALEASGELQSLRQQQNLRWMWAQIKERLVETFRCHPAIKEQLAEMESAVLAGTLPPTAAADALLDFFH